MRRISAESALKRLAWRDWRFRLSIWLSQLAGHILQPLQIGFGTAQAQLRLVAARMQAGNAGGLFQQLPAGLRLGGNQLADATLPHHGGRARAVEASAKSNCTSLARASLPLIAIDRALLALDAARHLDLVGIVEGGRRGAVGIVEEKADFGGVAGRPIAGAGEDHVVHAEARMFL